VLDREWEKEQRREMDEMARSFQRSTPGCFGFLSRPHPSSERRTHPSFHAARSPVLYVDFANPGMSTLGNVVNETHEWKLFPLLHCILLKAKLQKAYAKL